MDILDEKLIKAIEQILDTRDKRFMFLKLEFPFMANKVILEDIIEICSYSIFIEFKKNNLLSDLMSIFELKFLYKFD